MQLKAVLFDLDGTLLPMDQDAFTKGYFKLLVQKMTPLGYEAQQLVDAVWNGTAHMVGNDGGQTNEQVFWHCFEQALGARVWRDKPVVDEFYRHEFERAREFCGFDAEAAQTVAWARQRGLRTVLASNPVFPLSAMHARARWAGLDPDDFELITSYENCSMSKPNPGFYRDIARGLGLDPRECLMVGNEVDEDMAALEAGMQVFLLTNCLINKSGRDTSAYPQGGFGQLRQHVATLG